MKRISMLTAIRSCILYQKSSLSDRKMMQSERLNKIVQYAKENSPYYAALYRNIKNEFSFTDLPTTNKTELMTHWNDWVTDPSVSLNKINNFMKNVDNIGRKLDGQYLIYTTSGSTGNPLISLCDNSANNVTGAINLLRGYARSEDMKEFIRRGGKSVGI